MSNFLVSLVLLFVYVLIIVVMSIRYPFVDAGSLLMGVGGGVLVATTIMYWPVRRQQ